MLFLLHCHLTAAISVITRKSWEGLLREGMGLQVGEGCGCLPYSTQAPREDVGAITVDGQAQLASQPAQPIHSLGWRKGCYEKHKLSCNENQCKDTSYSFYSPDPNILDIESLLLVDTIAMLYPSALALIFIDGLNLLGIGQRYVGEQDSGPVYSSILSDQDPDPLVGVG